MRIWGWCGDTQANTATKFVEQTEEASFDKVSFKLDYEPGIRSSDAIVHSRPFSLKWAVVDYHG